MHPNVEFLRLRSQVDDTYLHAADDGCSVHLDARQGSYNAIWAVERHLWTDGQGPATPHVLLRGSYGRYLGALNTPSSYFRCPQVAAAQHDFDEPEVKAIMWQVVKSKGEDKYTLQSASGCYLQNVPMRRNSSKSCLWKVEKVHRSLGTPQFMIDEKTKLVKFLAWLELPCSSERKINWVLANIDGSIDESYWGNLLFEGRDVLALEEELRQLVVLPTTLCIRAGRKGQPTPLCIDLPKSKETLNIVLFLKNTPGNARLVHPDVNHVVGALKLD